jgi:hypothetical protein
MEFQLTPIRPIARDASDTPTLQVVVDTEEEFDWGKPFNPASIAVRHMRRLERLQRLCEPFGLHPTYVADFPVVSQADGFEPLKEVLADRVAQVGVHRHPWVNPPYEEKVCAKNSYPGNLPAKLEQSKLQRLMEAHEAAFGFRPDIYKAGRYGIGTNSIRTLRLLGFNIDMSVCSGFDFRRDGGPDFRGYPAAPWWWAEGLLEIPTSGAFVGWLHSLGPNLFSAINHPRLGSINAEPRGLFR